MLSHWKARFRSAWWIVSFIAVVGLTSQAVHGQSSSTLDSDDTRERLVMLKTGRILSGQLSRNAGGYLVEQPNGRVQVAHEDVQFIVNDLREGYRRQRDSVTYPTPASHVALANWCISHRLYDEARDELKKCLKNEPENEEARRLLQRLTDTIRANLTPAPTKPVPLKTVDGFLQPDVESLGGLTRETAMQFTSKIQPLLLNKCGNASCHGNASTNGFRLTPARIGGNGSRQNTERNLAEAIKYVDFENVGRSPLLSISTAGHGGKGTIFVGTAGSEQLKLLKTWAKAVAEEKQADAREFEQRPVITAKKSLKGPKSRGENDENRQVNTAAFEVQKSDDEPRASMFKPVRPRELPADEEAPTELKPFDPFDPEIFNRRPR